MDLNLETVGPAVVALVAFSLIFYGVGRLVKWLIGAVGVKSPPSVSPPVYRGGDIFLPLGVLVLLVIGLMLFTPLPTVLAQADAGFWWFAGALMFAMALIYFLRFRPVGLSPNWRNVHGAVFAAVLVVFFSACLMVAQKNQEAFLGYFNKQWVRPIASMADAARQNQENATLLDELRGQYYGGKCVKTDYGEQAKANFVNQFLLVGADERLAFGDRRFDPADPNQPLSGMVCRNSGKAYLLTENGNWYWVSEERIN